MAQKNLAIFIKKSIKFTLLKWLNEQIPLFGISDLELGGFSETRRKDVQKMSKKCPKNVQKMSKRCPTCITYIKDVHFNKYNIYGQ